jgi:uncharacterized membrane protein YhaH (DUF805 family)
MLHFLFSFKGRINRAKVWLFYLVGGAFWGLTVAGIFVAASYAGIPNPLAGIFLEQQLSLGGWFYLGMLVLAYVILVYCFMAVAAKRLHDRGKSAWWLVAAYGTFIALSRGINVLLDLPIAYSKYEALAYIILFASMIMMGSITIWLMMELFVLPGTRGENRFGPDPRRIDGPKGAA